MCSISGVVIKLDRKMALIYPYAPMLNHLKAFKFTQCAFLPLSLLAKGQFIMSLNVISFLIGIFFLFSRELEIP